MPGREALLPHPEPVWALSLSPSLLNRMYLAEDSTLSKSEYCRYLPEKMRISLLYQNAPVLPGTVGKTLFYVLTARLAVEAGTVEDFAICLTSIFAPDHLLLTETAEAC